MTVNADVRSPHGRVDVHSILTTRLGVQANNRISRRRYLVFTLNVVSWMALLLWTASILQVGGWTVVDVILFSCVAVGLPWPAMGFWNALIGFALRLRGQRGLDAVAPFLAAGDSDTPIAAETAVFMTVRNEDPMRALRRLETVQRSLDATGSGAHFTFFVLSDSDDDAVVASEQAAVTAWSDRLGGGLASSRIVYRRRAHNAGYKAGNVRDFCQRYGDAFEFMLPLDADSIMTGPAILRLVRIMQGHPEIGILQSLVVGTPSTSPFARLFQFGMRHGMRVYTLGQAWWTADCGPYWGHNALLRVKPFAAHCTLPTLPGTSPLSGAILSHDQVEAVLMRRAGYEVRVMPVEDGSYEDNPPDALAFMQREQRWCQGNLQYLKLRGLQGLKPVSRFQLTWAVLMFVGIPAWTVAVAILPLAAMQSAAITDFPAGSLAALYLTYLALSISPKFFGVLDTITTPGEVGRFGGGVRYAVSVTLEVLFSFIQGAAGAVRTTLFMFGLVFGKAVGWTSQQRDAHGVTWAAASAALWPSLVFGLIFYALMGWLAPTALVWLLPLTIGYLLAIPLAVLTGSGRLGAWMQRRGVAAIPEDLALPAEIAASLVGPESQPVGLESAA